MKKLLSILIAGIMLLTIAACTEKKENDKPSFEKSKDEVTRDVKLAKLDPTKGQEAIKKVIDDADIDVKDKDLKDAF